MAAEVALFDNFSLKALLTEKPSISGTLLLKRPWLMSLLDVLPRCYYA